MNKIGSYLNSSIGRKQIVATSGLILISFIIMHLAGNLFIYGGPEALNGYAEKLQHLRPFLYILEFSLFAIFLTHIYFTTELVLENIRSRNDRYAIFQPVGDRSFATKAMPYTGTIILVFVLWHLLDFTFIDHEGPRSVMPNGEHLGVYGVVYNAFSNPLHSIAYIIAMIAIGLHLSHSIQSFFQTFGFYHSRYTPLIKKVSNGIGLLITVGYSTIPIYVLIDSTKYLKS